MVLWYCGTVVLWYCGTVVLWYCGTVVWYCGVVLWCGIVVWYCGAHSTLNSSTITPRGKSVVEQGVARAQKRSRGGHLV